VSNNINTNSKNNKNINCSNISLENSKELYIKNEKSNTNVSDSISFDNEDMILSKLNSSIKVNGSKLDLENNSVEKKLKQVIDKELSFNYLDENEQLFSSLINKETLLKEYVDIRRRIDKIIKSNDQDNIDNNINNSLEDPNAKNNMYLSFDHNKNESSESLNEETKNIIYLLDKMIEKVIENEKVI